MLSGSPTPTAMPATAPLLTSLCVPLGCGSGVTVDEGVQDAVEDEKCERWKELLLLFPSLSSSESLQQPGEPLHSEAETRV